MPETLSPVPDSATDQPTEWQPYPEDQFHLEHGQTESDQALEIFYELLSNNNEADDRGSELGKAFVQAFECGYGHFTKEQYEDLEVRLKTFLGDEEGSIYYSGFLTELAAASIFTQLGYETYYPLPIEDEDGVDWWVDLKDVDNGVMAVQVKAVPLGDWVKNDVLYPIQSEADIQQLLDRLILPDNLDVKNSNKLETANELRSQVADSLRKVLLVQGDYDRVIPAAMILPSPSSSGSEISRLTGQPVVNKEGNLNDNKLVQTILDAMAAETFPRV